MGAVTTGNAGSVLDPGVFLTAVPDTDDHEGVVVDPVAQGIGAGAKWDEQLSPPGVVSHGPGGNPQPISSLPYHQSPAVLLFSRSEKSR